VYHPDRSGWALPRTPLRDIEDTVRPISGEVQATFPACIRPLDPGIPALRHNPQNEPVPMTPYSVHSCVNDCGYRDRPAAISPRERRHIPQCGEERLLHGRRSGLPSSPGTYRRTATPAAGGEIRPCRIIARWNEVPVSSGRSTPPPKARRHRYRPRHIRRPRRLDVRARHDAVFVAHRRTPGYGTIPPTHRRGKNRER
jgi:hypothetical protein